MELGQLLVNTDYIHHVVDEHHFEDSYFFFRFRVDGKSHTLMCAKTSIYISIGHFLNLLQSSPNIHSKIESPFKKDLICST